MKVVLVGNGAREHAIAERLAEDCELYAVMSKKNPAIAQLSKEYWICDIENPKEVKSVLEGKDFDLGFASPDATLEAGVSDALAECGMLVASPSKAASRVEWDKSYMRSLHEKHKVGGCPLHDIVADAESAARLIKEYGQVAIKPLGLSGGKGVKVSGDHFINVDEKIAYADSLIKKDGRVLIEEKLVGEEFTLQAFCDGSRIA
jgi:phosphoribosylamine--glycine ligase